MQTIQPSAFAYEPPRIVLLTGAVGVGKSTVAKRAVALIQPRALGGFVTVSVPENGALSVYIAAHNKMTPRDASHRIGVRHGAGRLTPYPASLENAGTAILQSIPPHAELIVLDELGTIESDAPRFREAVLSALSGSLPALCVIKPKHTPFLDAVRALPNSVLLHVTAENRDALPQTVAGLLRRSVGL